MGVIQRQGSKQAIVRVLGVLIGFLSVLFVYPLELKSYGHAQFLLSSAMVITPVLGLGLSQSSVKYFSMYDTYTGGKKGFLNIILLLHVVPFITFIGLFLIARNWIHTILGKWSKDTSLFIQNEWYILGIASILMLYGTLTMYISNYGRIVVPSIFMDLAYKLFLPIVIILIYFGFIDYDLVGPLIIIFFSIALLLLFVYASKLNILTRVLDFTFLSKRRIIEILKFSIFSTLSGLGAILAFRIDAVMVAELLDEISCGVYFNILVIAMIIDIPNQAMGKIAAPIISKSWTNDSIADIQSIYSKASLNSFIIGALIFLCILFNLQDIFKLSTNPEAFVGATQVFIFLGLAKLIDAATGINSQILMYSKYYKYNLFFLLMLGGFNIGLNYFFVKGYGLMGAAIATFISLTLYNLLKFYFIKHRMGFNPFSIETFKVFAIVVFVFLLIFILPTPSNVILSILFRTIILVVVFVSIIYYSKVSVDFNSLIKKWLSYIAIH